MIDTALELADLAEFFSQPCWKWFKQFCAEQARIQQAEILGSDPYANSWAISRAQGYYEAMNAIADGMKTPNGKTTFEDYLLDKLSDQLAANGESDQRNHQP